MLKPLSKFILLILPLIPFFGCNNKTNTAKADFVTINDGKFYKNNEPYYYIGANYWYGANLAADTVGGNRERLLKELDFLKANGVDNLRISVGAEGPDNQPFRVTPALITSPREYREVILVGLDYLLTEMKKRDMLAILYFTNNWEWSGGMAQYLNWNGYGDYVNPNLEKYSWDDFYNYQKQFYSCDSCIEQVNHLIKHIVTRTNSISNIKYINDPTIMAWELANEPRPMANDNFEPFKKWIKQTSELIQQLDKNHLVTTGNEGEKGCSESLELFEEIHAYPSIDYITFHIWVKNWGWYNYEKADSTFSEAIKKVKKYFTDHIEIAQKLDKPIVLEEFGIARDNEVFSNTSPVNYRNKYYNFVYQYIANSYNNGGHLAGANFWTFGGFTEPQPDKIFWSAGDPYSGDPPQEEQGLNSVYPNDTSTFNIIKKYNKKLNRISE